MMLRHVFIADFHSLPSPAQNYVHTQLISKSSKALEGNACCIFRNTQTYIKLELDR